MPIVPQCARPAPSCSSAAPSQIRAPLFVAVLAYHGVHLLCTRLRRAGIRDSWEMIRRKLAGWVRLTTSLQTAHGDWDHCRHDAWPDAAAEELARPLGMMLGLDRHGTTRAATGSPPASANQ